MFSNVSYVYLGLLLEIMDNYVFIAYPIIMVKMSVMYLVVSELGSQWELRAETY